MKNQQIVMFGIAWLLTGRIVMGIEEPGYQVVQSDQNIELRSYDSFAIAETDVRGTFSEAGNIAFRKLFRYIQGENKSRQTISMTAPVGLQSSTQGESIAMTAPVAQTQTETGYRVSFALPSSLTAETAPLPNDSSVILRQIPARSVAVLRYSGTWSQERYEAKRKELLQWISAKHFTPQGEPVLARYNSPFSLWFLRRNEVQIDVETTPHP